MKKGLSERAALFAGACNDFPGWEYFFLDFYMDV